MAQQFEFSPSFLLPSITSRHFAVPQYQRSYSWTEENLNDFWLDMRRSIADGGEYFLGSFVLSKEDGADYFSIIDGQQRIATTTILLSAMRDAYRENGREKLAESFDTQFLRQHDVETDEYRRRLRLNAVDDPFYLDVIIYDKPEVPAAESHERLRFAKAFFLDNLRKLVSDNPATWGDRFSEITRYLKSQARIVVVETATDADAYTIFETLNDRGADLTIADLLKNYLLSRAKGEIEAVRQLWVEAITVLDDVQGEKEFVGFLRQLWSSYHGITRERDLYRSIKASVEKPADALRFARQLKDAAHQYRAILSSEADYWSAYERSTRDHVSVLSQLSLQQNRPLLLAVLSKMSKDEIAVVVRNLVAWGVRGIVAGHSGGGQLEKYYCDAAVDVRNGKIKSAAELRTALSPIIPNDAVFSNAFASMRVTKNSLARYYLCAIEKSRRGEKEPELILNEDAKQMNLEHILPQNPTSADWSDFTSDEASAYAYRLGNMTLLQRSANQKLGNGPWTQKRTVLQSSALHLNAELSAVEEWTKDVIEDRQEELAQEAIGVWPNLS